MARDKLAKIMKRLSTGSPELQKAFDDGALWGANDMRQQVLKYLLDDYIMDEKIDRGSPEYEAALGIIRKISDRFGKKAKSRDV